MYIRASIQEEDRRVYVMRLILLSIAGSIHVALIVWYGGFGRWWAVGVNCGSVAWYAMTILVLKSGRQRTAMALGFTEAVAHGLAFTLLLGLQAGYVFYNFAFVTVAFLAYRGHELRPRITLAAVSVVMTAIEILAMRGRTRVELRQSAKGEMSLSGTNLTLAGVDLDKQLLKFESSQNFNLIDVGAFLFAGPVGLVVTKGLEFSSLAQQDGGSTQVRTVVSKWKVEKGVAYARDAALATNENRLAIHGGLDFVDAEYQDVIIALVDSKGCIRVSQKISGPFSKPSADKSVFLVPVGPLLKLLDKAKTLFLGPDNNCEVFYRGSVAPPK